MQLRYREVGTVLAICSSGTGRWAQQLYAAQVQGDDWALLLHRMYIRYRVAGYNIYSM
jgi:hypothetical protein